MSEENVSAPYIPNTFLTIFKNDYPYIQELLEYKRDGTLLFLKTQGALAFYDISFGLDVANDVKDWQEFIEFSKNYTRNFVQQEVQKYQNDEKNEKDEKKKFKNLDMGILGPAIEIISNAINDKHLKSVLLLPKSSGTLQDFIEIDIKYQQERNDERFYCLCRGTILVKDTKYSSPRNGCYYRSEFSGKTKFQLSYFDLEKIRICNEMTKKNMAMIKKGVDKCEEKLLESQMSKLLISMEF